MARTLTRNSQVYPAGTYGPFSIDGRRLGDRGARIEFTRDTDGTWPLTSADPVLEVSIEGLYDGQWLFLASATFFGGQQPARFGGVRLAEYMTVEWPQERVNGVLTPQPPDEVRITAVVAAVLRTGLSVQWL